MTRALRWVATRDSRSCWSSEEGEVGEGGGEEVEEEEEEEEEEESC